MAAHGRAGALPCLAKRDDIFFVADSIRKLEGHADAPQVHCESLADRIRIGGGRVRRNQAGKHGVTDHAMAREVAVGRALTLGRAVPADRRLLTPSLDGVVPLGKGLETGRDLRRIQPPALVPDPPGKVMADAVGVVSVGAGGLSLRYGVMVWCGVTMRPLHWPPCPADRQAFVIIIPAVSSPDRSPTGEVTGSRGVQGELVRLLGPGSGCWRLASC